MKLKGKTALVTGGSRGIGKAIAKAFAKEGASVIICGRTEGSLRDACEEISKYGEVDYIKADIVNKDDVKRFATRLSQKWDKLDILVNNASILGDRVSISGREEDAARKDQLRLSLP